MQRNDDKYDAEVFKRLDAFKNAVGWSDFIGLLGSLDQTLKKSPHNYIPHRPLLIKRLNQCLNPLLPAGVHLKTIESYSVIFNKLTKDALISDFGVLTIGLFNFSLNCRILVMTDYLDLLEKYVVPLGAKIERYSKSVILALLVSLESESSEFFLRAYLLLLNFSSSVDQKIFYDGLWEIFIEYPEQQMSIINFIVKSKTLPVTDFRLLAKIFCISFESSNPYLVRSAMDFSNRDFPFSVDGSENSLSKLHLGIESGNIVGDSNRTTINDRKEVDNERIESGNIVGDSNRTTINDRKDVDNERNEAIEKNISNSPAGGLNGSDSIKRVNSEIMLSDTQSKIMIEDDKVDGSKTINNMKDPLSKSLEKSISKSTFSLATSITETTAGYEDDQKKGIVKVFEQLNYSQLNDEDIKMLLDEMTPYNAQILKGVLKIFLKREAGTNKRIYKWFNISESFNEKDVKYIERGLREFINESEEDLMALFKILLSLADREDLVSVLMNLLIIDAFEMVSKVCKSSESLSKFSKMFSMLGLDELWQTFYLKLRESIIEEQGGRNPRINKEKIQITVEKHDLNSDNYNIGTSNIIKDKKCDRILSTILFVCKNFEIVDNHVKNIHLPCMALTIVKNKRMIDIHLFKEFMDLFIVNVDTTSLPAPGQVVDGSAEERVVKAYEDETFKGISGSDLLIEIAKELSKVEIYESSGTFYVEFKDCELVEIDGVLEYREIFKRKGRKIAKENIKYCDENDCKVRAREEALREQNVMDNYEDEIVPGINRDIGVNNYALNDSRFIKKEDEIQDRNYNNNTGILNDGELEGNPLINTEMKGPDLRIIFRDEEVKILKSFIEKFGMNGFSEDFLIDLGRFVEMNYKYLGCINILGDIVNRDELYNNLWSDFICSKNASYLFFYDLTEYIVRRMPNSNFMDMVIFLTDSVKKNKYLEVLFYFSGIADHDSCEYKQLVSSIENPGFLVKFLLDKFGQCDIESAGYRYTGQPDFNQIKAILMMVRSLLENGAMRGLLNSDTVVQTDVYGEINILEGITNMLFQLIVTEESGSDNNIESLEKRGMLEDSIKLDDSGVNEENLKIGNISQENKERPFDEQNKELEKGDVRLNNPPLINPASIYSASVVENGFKRASLISTCLEVRKLSFDVLSVMNQYSIPISFKEIEPIKHIVKKYRHDYYIVKRSLFLMKDNINFIINYCLANYRDVFDEIALLGIENEFLKVFLSSNYNFSLDLIVCLFPHLKNIHGFKWDIFYQIALNSIVKAVFSISIKYSRFDDEYRFISSTYDSETEGASNQELNGAIYKDIISKEDAERFWNDLSEDIFLYNDDLSEIINFSYSLFIKDSPLFSSSMFKVEFSEFLFYAIPFKREAFRCIIAHGQAIGSDYQQIIRYVRCMPLHLRIDIFKADAEFFKSTFGYPKVGYGSSKLVLEFMRGFRTNETVKLILSNILYHLETKIGPGIRLDLDFTNDIAVLDTMRDVEFTEHGTVTSFKNCLFTLLGSKYRSTAFMVIYAYMKQTKSKIFAEAFIQNFNSEFFGFCISEKKVLMKSILTSGTMNPTTLINVLFQGLDDSYFQSASSNNMQKILTLKQIGFLLLCMEKDTFANSVEKLVSSINMLLTAPIEVKVHVYNLCSIIALKVDHKYVMHLYPILFEDFYKTLSSSNLLLCEAALNFADICIWLKSPILNFKPFILEDNEFSLHLRRVHNVTDPSINSFSIPSLKVPNFFKMIKGKNEVSEYLRDAPAYYRTVQSTFITNDYEAVEASLIETISRD